MKLCPKILYNLKLTPEADDRHESFKMLNNQPMFTDTANAEPRSEQNGTIRHRAGICFVKAYIKT
jgi:hypothetical protein